MQIPPPLPPRQAREGLKYCFWLSSALIFAMFILGLQNRDYQSFEKMAWLIIGGIVGALKLQSSSN
jgi:hypothetical protein